MNEKHPGGTMKQTSGPTKSQYLPVNSDIFRMASAKAYFWPGVITCIAVVLLFIADESARTFDVDCFCQVPTGKIFDDGSIAVIWKTISVEMPLYLYVLGLYVTCGLAWAAYRMIGRKVDAWVIPVVGIVTGVLSGTVVLNWVHILDFGVSDLGHTFSPISIVQGFFHAGLPEETLKAIPVFFGVWLGRRLTDRSNFLWQLRVTEPIDGILIGVASGLGFTFAETFSQYVPQQIVFALHHVELNHHLVTDAAALQLLIPRILQNIAGHAAWAGIFGYYIGLAAMRRTDSTRDQARIVLTGLGIAAFLHGSWDSAPPAFLEVVIAVASFAILAGCIVKSRQISPHRSQIIASQVYGAEGAALARAAASAMPGKPAPATSPKSMTWGPKSVTWGDTAPAALSLEVNGRSLALTSGTRLLEGQLPGLKALGTDGIVAMVDSNPDDPQMLGLKNLSTASWHVITVARGTRELSSGRSIRIEKGTQIQLGELNAAIR
jgi:RsiW-degrading membrane proteinase PrsW (M82 family)